MWPFTPAGISVTVSCGVDFIGIKIVHILTYVPPSYNYYLIMLASGSIMVDKLPMNFSIHFSHQVMLLDCVRQT